MPSICVPVGIPEYALVTEINIKINESNGAPMFYYPAHLLSY